MWWREVIDWRDVAKQLKKVPVERGGECEVSKPDLGRGVAVRRVTLQEVRERFVIQQVIHQS